MAESSHTGLVLLEFQNISSCSTLVNDQNLNSITLQCKYIQHSSEFLPQHHAVLPNMHGENKTAYCVDVPFSSSYKGILDQVYSLILWQRRHPILQSKLTP